MISFLRDCYVDIPDYLNNRLNVAYTKGGGPLMVETIEENFKLKVDGYVRVEFKDFEKIIDKLGGVEITLSDEEAEYLNSTNYISKRKYRNVKEGKQILNGNQALGYCRIRKKPTIDGIYDDWGRTSRQRRVLQQVYEKYRMKNAAELILVLNDVLPLATTNMKKSDLVYLMRLVLSLRIENVETLSIPTADSYQNSDIPERGIMGVLELDFESNIKEIDDFLNEEGEYEKPIHYYR
jgi:LCP family protein required for cell wall assembly